MNGIIESLVGVSFCVGVQGDLAVPRVQMAALKGVVQCYKGAFPIYDFLNSIKASASSSAGISLK